PHGHQPPPARNPIYAPPRNQPTTAYPHSSEPADSPPHEPPHHGHAQHPPTPHATHPEGTSRRMGRMRSEEHTSELQSRFDLVCRLLLEKNNASVPPQPV